ncbi:MAG: phenylalanine--tRNA ligase subunit alpha [Ilumatobacteraceae bacterium]
MTPEIDEARGAALTAITQAETVADLERVVAEHLGKRGALAGLKKGLGGIDDPEARRAAGAAMHAARTAVEEAVEQRRDELGGAETEQRIAEERLDLTEFRSDGSRGHLHIVTQAWQRLEDVFLGLGFSVAEGPEVETDWHNFEALNMGEGHPARGEFDTLFVDHVPPGGRLGTTLLRTHTSPVQIRTMLTQEPPIYVVAPGRVFRRDTPDATHMPVFHQIEGLVVDRGISMTDLAGTIEAFTKAFFGAGFTSRLRPSYFPFTEPSAEFDIQRPDGSWLELGGCGMVHPSVIRAGGLDPDEWSGFAFGFGIDRMAVMRHGVADIRDMYVNDIRFVEQF